MSKKTTKYTNNKYTSSIIIHAGMKYNFFFIGKSGNHRYYRDHFLVDFKNLQTFPDFPE